jgi:hypothetical protein
MNYPLFPIYPRLVAQNLQQAKTALSDGNTRKLSRKENIAAN